MVVEILQRYLDALPEGSRVVAYNEGNKEVLAVARTWHSKVKYYDKYTFDMFGELIPIKPDKEVKWENMKEVEYARKRWQEEIEKEEKKK